MPSLHHEGLVELLRESPELLLELLRVRLPGLIPAATRVEAADIHSRVITPLERRVDLLLTLSRTDERAPGTAQAGVVLIAEVQLRRDARKALTWPLVVATARERHRCPVVLVVLTRDRRTAAWARGPFGVESPGLSLRPLVLGPDDIPRVTDVAEARRAPYRALLSAFVHLAEPEGGAIAPERFSCPRGARTPSATGRCGGSPDRRTTRE